MLLRESGVFIRECGSKLGSGPQFLRIATRPPDEQRLLVSALRRPLHGVDATTTAGVAQRHLLFVGCPLEPNALASDIITDEH